MDFHRHFAAHFTQVGGGVLFVNLGDPDPKPIITVLRVLSKSNLWVGVDYRCYTSVEFLETSRLPGAIKKHI